MVDSAEDFLDGLAGRPGFHHCMGFKNLAGGCVAMLIKLHGEPLPSGLICGKTFKVRRKYIEFFGKRFVYPFQLDLFLTEYQKKKEEEEK